MHISDSAAKIVTKHLSVDFDRLHSAWSNEEKRAFMETATIWECFFGLGSFRLQ